MGEYLAHVRKLENDSWATPHALDEHLHETARLSKEFAALIGPEWAQLAGKWHDLGKFRKRFQDYIRLQSGYERENAHIENGKRAPHSTAGAIHAIETLGPGMGHILAYLIAGHHAGLPDWTGGKGSLEYRLKEGFSEYQEAVSESISDEILAGTVPEIPDTGRSVDSIALWMRMLFSCLVDADFLDTEAYMQPEKAKQRNALSLDDLQLAYSASMERLTSEAAPSALNTIRREVLARCLETAEQPPGLFSLTVPTGGGKTLSSLAFALTHAKNHQKSRIIYAIPFTSIIEQNAQVFRNFLGDDAVLEHHSNLDVEPKKENVRARLATENWDAPLIVTTNVQLFESLHASRTSRCRKLHNLVNSVIILDEAQQLPRDFHQPVTQVMQQLSDHFGVTWVLCTATQPELGYTENTFGQTLLKGLTDVREIISDPAQLARNLERVDVHMPGNHDPGLSWHDLAEKISNEDCLLSIVNTKLHARNLYQLVNNDGNAVHLSTNMCAEHRTEALQDIRDRLDAWRTGETRPLRVVSTQLIEAGVDVDFPVVYRAMAGLDSIAQSAGRCNREGKLKNSAGETVKGQVYIFKPERPAPPGPLRQGEDITLGMIANGELAEPLSPKSFKRYFDRFNSRGSRDKHDICGLLRMNQPTQDAPVAIQFREAAGKFRLIDNQGESIVVPFVPEGKEKSPVHQWLDILEHDPGQRWVYRKLQRYTITLRESQLKQYPEGTFQIRAGLRVLLDCYYSPEWGLDVADKSFTSKVSVI